MGLNGPITVRRLLSKYSKRRLELDNNFLFLNNNFCTLIYSYIGTRYNELSAPYIVIVVITSCMVIQHVLGIM